MMRVAQVVHGEHQRQPGGGQVVHPAPYAVGVEWSKPKCRWTTSASPASSVTTGGRTPDPRPRAAGPATPDVRRPVAPHPRRGAAPGCSAAGAHFVSPMPTPSLGCRRSRGRSADGRHSTRQVRGDRAQLAARHAPPRVATLRRGAPYAVAPTRGDGRGGRYRPTITLCGSGPRPPPSWSWRPAAPPEVACTEIGSRLRRRGDGAGAVRGAGGRRTPRGLLVRPVYRGHGRAHPRQRHRRPGLQRPRPGRHLLGDRGAQRHAGGVPPGAGAAGGRGHGSRHRHHRRASGRRWPRSPGPPRPPTPTGRSAGRAATSWPSRHRTRTGIR